MPSIDGRLIEIQQASLAALRHKVRTLLPGHDVTVVKPLAARKLLIRRKWRGGAVLSSRYSPRRETIADLFCDLVHFVGVFPHPRLTLEVGLHAPGGTSGRRPEGGAGGARLSRARPAAGRNRRAGSTLKHAHDLARLLPAGLADVFSTEEIARHAAMPRWLAQKMAYCLGKTGAVEVAGKRGNAWLYQRTGPT